MLLSYKCFAHLSKMSTLEPEVIPDFYGEVSIAHHFSIVVLCCYMSLHSEFCVVMSVTFSAWKRCSVRLCLWFFVGGLVSYLRCLCLFSYSAVFRRTVCRVLPVSLNCLFFIATSKYSLPFIYMLPVEHLKKTKGQTTTYKTLHKKDWTTRTPLRLLYRIY